jgi:hypothetical protein
VDIDRIASQDPGWGRCNVMDLAQNFTNSNLIIRVASTTTAMVRVTGRLRSVMRTEIFRIEKFVADVFDDIADAGVGLADPCMICNKTSPNTELSTCAVCCMTYHRRCHADLTPIVPEQVLPGKMGSDDAVLVSNSLNAARRHSLVALALATDSEPRVCR